MVCEVHKRGFQKSPANKDHLGWLVGRSDYCYVLVFYRRLLVKGIRRRHKRIYILLNNIPC